MRKRAITAVVETFLVIMIAPRYGGNKKGLMSLWADELQRRCQKCSDGK
jgi:hypothetical protein